MENYSVKDDITNSFHANNEDEILIGRFLNFLNRKKKQILSATFGATTLVVLFTYTQKNIWQGNFRILIQKNQRRTRIQS